MQNNHTLALAIEPASPEELAIKQWQLAQQALPDDSLFQRMVDQIMSFAGSLDHSHEPGLRPADRPAEEVIRLVRLSFVPPNLIVFDGQLQSGEATRLIQQLDRANVMLVSVPRSDVGAPKRAIQIGP